MAEHAVRTVGRPSLSRRGTSPEVKARVPEALREALLERAQREHKRPSTVLREALEAYLKAS
ncbi:CopG family transcriptional regulator [Phytoactinopolyspora alkaliphila]|uniref:CopG family transcriptional regulator n=2 Tax=Phytoactinopolyspora alkaliphila TaxID=1783498 RepID=A0A6N9YJ58_9ACTN|nr:CopG family transcriptional regulator [Phytoactinopolyspora alkaliphila]